jgi:hypothetical protein
MEQDDLRLHLNEIKKHTFYELLNLAGRVYLLVRYSENVMIGNRGFLPNEKEQGLVLVLNTKMNFTWDEYGISVKLVFGESPQQCFIPADDILVVYSPELKSQLVVEPQEATTRRKVEEVVQKAEDTEESSDEESKKGKVVRLNFKKNASKKRK